VRGNENEKGKRMKRVLILFLTYGEEYKGALEKFVKKCCCITAEKRFIVIRNDDESKPLEQIDEMTFEMGGDNSVFEFSGWQKAIESDASRSFDPDVYLIANDAFLAKQFYATPVIVDEAIEAVSSGAVLGGNTRRFSFNAEYGKRDLSPYVSTHCFFISRQAMDGLGTMVSEKCSEKFIKPEYDSDMFTENEIWNDKLKRYLISTLTHKYHKKGIKADREHFDFFRRKILCIVNEMLLSVRVRELGGQIKDLTPFPRFCNSSLTFFIVGTTIRPFQFIRKAILQMLYILFCNRLAKWFGLDEWFMKKCVHSVKSDQLKGIVE
jgi:hypothetical protein